MKKTAAEKARDKSKVKEHPIIALAANPIFNTLRASMLAHEHGDPAEQKNKLVADILGMFDHPNEWPLTDSERIGLLKHLYRQARKIRDTENAIKAAS
jgi:hypothetical protein